jgi:ribosome biogenesis GTPase
LASSANVDATIILTKVDLNPDPSDYQDRAQKLTINPVRLINATQAEDCQNLLHYLGPGRTASLIGSSGVGKSTIVNGLLGEAVQKTQPIRTTDGKGVHTTTARSLHIIPDSGVIIDSPGVREIALVTDRIDLSSSFNDIEELAMQCRFNDCRHDKEPDCAIRLAVQNGKLDARRWESFLKLSTTKPNSG